MVLAENQKLLIPSKSENIVLVEKLVDDVCDLFDIQEDLYGHILVALTEAVNNGLQHGNKANPTTPPPKPPPPRARREPG